MGGKPDTRRTLAWFAARQHGVVTRRQLLATGVSGRAVDGLIARDELRVVHRGVLLATSATSSHAREMAAVLACGPTAAVSHLSAACLYGILPYPAKPVPVHVTASGARERQDVHVHRANLAPHEVRERHGIPLTAPVRTIVDLAGWCDGAELEAAVAEACALRLVTVSQLARSVVPGRRGVRRLRALLDAGPKRTRSAPERQLLAGLRAAGVEEPLTNAPIAGWEVDFYWPDHGFVVEIDGYAAHSSPTAFERDRRKDAELAELGLQVQRFSARRVCEERDAVVAWIRSALAA